MIRSNREPAAGAPHGNVPRRIRRIALGAVMLIILAAHNVSAQSDHTLEFADWLKRGGDDANAEREYLRYLFDTSSADARAIMPLAEIYRERGDAKALNGLADAYLPRMTDGNESAKLAFLKGVALLSLGDFGALDRFLADSSATGSDYMTAISLAGCVYKGQPESAKAILSGASDSFRREELVSSLAKDIDAYRPKSEGVAIALSAVIPGLGKAYAGQTADAILSFVGTGSLVTMTVLSAMNDGGVQWKPWAYGITAGIAYGANLYGSREAALRYNDSRLAAMREKTDEILDGFPRK